jgi:hypothetical protein
MGWIGKVVGMGNRGRVMVVRLPSRLGGRSDMDRMPTPTVRSLWVGCQLFIGMHKVLTAYYGGAL